MSNEVAGFRRPVLTFLSRLREVRAALLLIAVAACSSSLGSGASGGSAGTAGAVGGTAGTGGTTGGVGGGGTGATEDCSNVPPGDPRFGCLPTYAEESAVNCQHAGSCGPLYATAIATLSTSRLCVYDAQGALVWASRCEDASEYCGNHCLTSAGPSPACAELPNACDAAASPPGN